MTSRPYRTTTALVATLTLMIPQTVPMAYAQEAGEALLCLDQSEPPCPEGEPVDGTPVGTTTTPDAPAPEAAPVAETAPESEAPEVAPEAEAPEVAPEPEAPTVAPEAGAPEIAPEAEAPEVAPEVEAPEAAPEAEVPEAAPETEAPAPAPESDPEPVAPETAPDAPAPEAAPEAVAPETPAPETLPETTEADPTSETGAAPEAPDDTMPEANAADGTVIDEVVTEDETTDVAPAETPEPGTPETDGEVTDEDIQAEIDATADSAGTEDATTSEDTATDTADDTGAEEQEPTKDTPETQVAEEPAVDPTVSEEPPAPPAAAAAEADGSGDTGDVVEEVLDDTNTRTAEEEFDTTVSEGAEEASAEDDGGMTNLEKALLLGLGAVAVGALVNNGRDEVVANTGDRVVVQGEDGLTVYRDDDALLRQAGATLRTQTFDDGSTRSVLLRADGSEVVTIRDSVGRVVRRTAYQADGTEVPLFNDLVAAEPVDVAQLRASKPDAEVMTASDAGDTGLEDYFTSGLVYDPGRTFSLRQIREISDVRTLVPALDLDAITFASGSAAIEQTELQSLVSVGLAMENMLAQNPSEVFLIEGHTDATGPDALNLALSDRRAETVALALTENFAIPPENLVVQGYGESFLKVATQDSEAANRRATVRRITPLLQVASN